MPRGRLSSSILVVLLLAVPALSGPDLLAKETLPASEPGICESDLRRRVGRLASDDFLGREAGAEGGRLASAWLADEMQRAGLEPAGVDGTYFQPFVIPRPVLADGNVLALENPEGREVFVVEEEWNPFALSPNAEVSGSLVFAGYGITAPGRGWDDYADVDVEGKVVLVLRKDPGWNDVRHAAFTAKLANAAKRGAVALLLCNDRASAGAKDPIGHWSARVGGRLGSGAIPYAFVKRAVASRLLFTVGGIDVLETAVRGGAPRASGKQAAPRPASVGVPRTVVELKTALGISSDTKARNVIGLVRGSDPEVADEVVVVGAHFDHLGFGRFGSLGGAAGAGKLHPGADDNASGTAAVVEIGEWLAAREPRPRRTVLLLAFTGEEKGLLGASHWIRNPTVPLEKVVALINMDMIGRYRDGGLLVGGVGTGEGLEALVTAAGARHGTRLRTSPGGSAPSDSLVFFRKRIPVLFLHTGIHGDYHRPSDTADRIDYPGLERVTWFTHDVTVALADRPERLAFTQPPRPKPPPMLGIRLDRSADERGVLIAGVTPGGPAARAGLQAGDVVVGLAGRMVKTLADLRGTLSQLQAGKAVRVVVVRDGERLEVEVVPVRRGRR